VCVLEFANGLARHAGYRRERIAMFLDDDYRVVEAPTRWMMDVAKRRSRSDATARTYAHILNRYLQWLDDAGYGSQAWQAVDEDIFDEYLIHIGQPNPRGDGRPPRHETLHHYASRIADFYDWAERNGYPHHLDIEAEELEHKLDNQLLLGHVRPGVAVTRLGFNLPTGRPALHEQELDKFVTQTDYEVALELMEDAVFPFMAATIRTTGLRPKELLQVPYRGKGYNAGFVPYDPGEVPDDPDRQDIFYIFESKGKRRSIQFPGKLWRVICERYIPLRRQRAEIYREKHGVSPRNEALWLTEDGNVVNYGILHYHFGKVVEKARGTAPREGGRNFSARRFTARMLRHSFATYFVYEALKRRERLGQSFVYDAALDEELRKMLGHNDVRTTLEYYVHLVNRFVHDDLLQDLKASQVDAGLSTILDAQGY
jgi:integrase